MFRHSLKSLSYVSLSTATRSLSTSTSTLQSVLCNSNNNHSLSFINSTRSLFHTISEKPTKTNLLADKSQQQLILASSSSSSSSPSSPPSFIRTTNAASARLFTTTSNTNNNNNNSNNSSIIPVIDLAHFYRGSAQDKAKLAQEINRACEDIGFLTIINHAVKPEIINNMKQITRTFFDSTVGIKREVPMTDEYPYGYSGYKEEILSKGYGDKQALADLKESFAIGPYNPAALMPAVRWPSQPLHMSKHWLAYYNAMEHLSHDLLRLFALALNLPENWFDDKIDHHRSSLRALNYPAQSSLPNSDQQLRAGAHTDYGSLTILLQDHVGGLQVKTRAGAWQDVPYIPDAFVINLGDLMARWTNDRWVSTLHRVKPSIPRRESIAFFHNINHDHLVTCLPTCITANNPAKYQPILAWDHLMEKHLASVKY